MHETLDRSLQEFDQQDTRESSVRIPTADELPGQIAPLHSRRQPSADLRQHLDVRGASPSSCTAPDRRAMQTTPGTEGCSTGQVAVDHPPQRSVANAVTPAVTDQEQRAALPTRATDPLDPDRVAARAALG
jgi:hypothetical protein